MHRVLALLLLLPAALGVGCTTHSTELQATAPATAVVGESFSIDYTLTLSAAGEELVSWGSVLSAIPLEGIGCVPDTVITPEAPRSVDSGSLECSCERVGTGFWGLTVSVDTTAEGLAITDPEDASGVVDCVAAGGPGTPAVVVTDYADGSHFVGAAGEVVAGPALAGTYVVGASCPAGKVVCGFDPDGAPACRSLGPDLSAWEGLDELAEQLDGGDGVHDVACAGDDGFLIADRDTVWQTDTAGASLVLDPEGRIESVGWTEHQGCYVTSGEQGAFTIARSPDCDGTWIELASEVGPRKYAGTADSLYVVNSWGSRIAKSDDGGETYVDVPELPSSPYDVAANKNGVFAIYNGSLWSTTGDGPFEEITTDGYPGGELVFSPSSSQWYSLSGAGLHRLAGGEGWIQVEVQASLALLLSN